MGCSRSGVSGTTAFFVTCDDHQIADSSCEFIVRVLTRQAGTTNMPACAQYPEPARVSPVLLQRRSRRADARSRCKRARLRQVLDATSGAGAVAQLPQPRAERTGKADRSAARRDREEMA